MWKLNLPQIRQVIFLTEKQTQKGLYSAFMETNHIFPVCILFYSCDKTMCQCDKGYVGNGTMCTRKFTTHLNYLVNLKLHCQSVFPIPSNDSDVNFCEINNGGCSPNARCEFDPSTLHTTCGCKQNYIGHGVFCQGELV